MPKIPEVTRQDGVIHKGDTFYMEVTLYDDAAHTILTDLDGYTPTATLMDSTGVTVSSFNCAVLEPTDSKPHRIAAVIPKAATALLALNRTYHYKLNLAAADGESYRKLVGELTVEL